MNLSIRNRAAWLGLLSLVLKLPAAAQEPVPEGEFAEQITVRVLNFEAVVTDRDGQRVPGLDASQFTLLVGGEEVPIEYFNEVRDGQVISSADNVPELMDRVGQPDQRQIDGDAFGIQLLGYPVVRMRGDRHRAALANLLAEPPAGDEMHCGGLVDSAGARVHHAVRRGQHQVLVDQGSGAHGQRRRGGDVDPDMPE